MPKPYSSTTSGKGHRQVRNSYRFHQGSELTSERRQQLALNRFTYRGGYDGFEGRMILKPDDERSSDRP
jgi:hypothetical protein